MAVAIQVSVRLRPFNSRETKYGSQLIIGMEGPNLEIKQVKQGKVSEEAPRKFTFDHCFWTHDPADKVRFAGQDQVYDTIGKNILTNSLQGFNSCLFAYGQTGSGKTYTMMGVPSDPGIIPRIGRDLFARAQATKDTNIVTVDCSYLEIYNEQIRDLLNPAQGDKPLKARQHPKLGVYVEGLTKLSANSEAEIEKFIEDGAMIRSVAATNMNAQSSRSHAILTLYIRNKGPTGELASQLHLVDLAGSERAASTGATGDTLVEGSNINKSLTTLGMCLSRLAEAAEGKRGHIPFRDSQLTWLLNDSLGGNSRTAMLANISPADINYEETLSTLRFAQTTKKIKNMAIVNEDPQQRLIRELRAEIAAIREQISNLDAGLAAAPSSEVGSDGTVWAPPNAEELTRQLSENIELMAQAVQSQEERDERDRQTKADREKALTALKQEEAKKKKKQRPVSMAVDSNVPRLITLNEDLHALPTVALLYYLADGANWVGADPSCLIHLPPTAVQRPEQLCPLHFLLFADAATRTVALQLPFESDREVHTDDQAGVDLSAAGGAPQVVEPSGSRPATVYVNGRPVESAALVQNNSSIANFSDLSAEQNLPNAENCLASVKLSQMDRIVVGQVAFRFTEPTLWIQAEHEGFSRQCNTLAHLRDLEAHVRNTIELQCAQGLAEALAEVEAADPTANYPPELIAALRAELPELVRAAAYRAGESETHMVSEYPLSDEAILEAVETAGEHAGLKYDYAFAMDEKKQHARETERRQREAERNAQLEVLQSEADAKNAEIAALQEALRRQEEETEQLRRKRQEMEDHANKPPVVQQPGSPAGTVLSPSTATPKTASAQEKIKLASELADYEESCRVAKLWKPGGPTIKEDQEEYQLSLRKPAVAQIRSLPGLTHCELTLQKYRIDKGLFSRTGYHPVFVIVKNRFFHYFENDKPQTKASGSVYLWGCEVQEITTHEKASEGKPNCIRIVPCVPRKDSKSARGVSDENNVVLHFPTVEEKIVFTKLIQALATPPMPLRVADYLATIGER